MSEYVPLADELRLIPRCMASVFENLNPITTLACTVVGCPFGDIAFDRLDFMLLEPKNNCFLLEWSSLYSGELFHSTWKQLSSRVPQLALRDREDPHLTADRELRRLTSSYETYLLESVAANVYRYSGLRTFIIDLSRTDHNVSYPFSPNIDRWAAVVKALLQQCKATLYTFVINDHPHSFIPALSVHFRTNLAPTLLHMPQLQILFAPLRIFYNITKGEEQPSLEQLTAEWQATLLGLGVDIIESGDHSKRYLPSLRRAVFWNFIRSETNWRLSPLSASLRLPQVQRVEYELRALPLRNETSAENLQQLLRRMFPRATIVQGAHESQRHYTSFDYHYSTDAAAAAAMNAPPVAVDAFAVGKIDEAASALAGFDQMRICRKQSGMNITLDLASVRNMKGFDVVLPIIARRSPPHWHLILKINGTEPWTSAWDVLKQWQCACDGSIAAKTRLEKDAERCACFHSKCKLDLHFTSRLPLSEVLCRWETECRTENSGTNESSPAADKNMFGDQVCVNRVKFRQLIDAGGRVTADAGSAVPSVDQRMSESMNSLLRDAVEVRENVNYRRLSAAVYNNIRRIDYDAVRVPQELAARAQSWQDDVKHMAFASLLGKIAGNQSAVVDEIGARLQDVQIKEEKSNTEMTAIFDDVVNHLTFGSGSDKLLVLPKLRKVFVNVKTV